jgi:hypothetical protein
MYLIAARHLVGRERFPRVDNVHEHGGDAAVKNHLVDEPRGDTKQKRGDALGARNLKPKEGGLNHPRGGEPSSMQEQEAEQKTDPSFASFVWLVGSEVVAAEATKTFARLQTTAIKEKTRTAKARESFLGELCRRYV